MRAVWSSSASEYIRVKNTHTPTTDFRLIKETISSSNKIWLLQRLRSKLAKDRDVRLKQQINVVIKRKGDSCHVRLYLWSVCGLYSELGISVFLRETNTSTIFTCTSLFCFSFFSFLPFIFSSCSKRGSRFVLKGFFHYHKKYLTHFSCLGGNKKTGKTRVFCEFKVKLWTATAI